MSLIWTQFSDEVSMVHIELPASPSTTPSSSFRFTVQVPPSSPVILKRKIAPTFLALSGSLAMRAGMSFSNEVLASGIGCSFRGRIEGLEVARLERLLRWREAV
ncbi:MAG: hypothetical protein R3B99_03250 [Polyangiales bacterium]